MQSECIRHHEYLEIDYCVARSVEQWNRTTCAYTRVPQTKYKWTRYNWYNIHDWTNSLYFCFDVFSLPYICDSLLLRCSFQWKRKNRSTYSIQKKYKRILRLLRLQHMNTIHTTRAHRHKYTYSLAFLLRFCCVLKRWLSVNSLCLLFPTHSQHSYRWVNTHFVSKLFGEKCVVCSAWISNFNARHHVWTTTTIL